MIRHFDLVIVGGSFAGLACAPIAAPDGVDETTQPTALSSNSSKTPSVKGAESLPSRLAGGADLLHGRHCEVLCRPRFRKQTGRHDQRK